MIFVDFLLQGTCARGLFLIYKRNQMFGRKKPGAMLMLLLILNIAAAQPIQQTAKKVTIMDQRLTFITIGAKNLDSLKNFYIQKFGWTPIKTDGIVFFKMNGIILALFPQDELAGDAGVARSGSGFKKFTLAVNYRSEQEVDGVFATLRQRGVHIVKAPHKTAWGGYSGYAADPEDNLWEIAYNPFLKLDDKGNVSDHQ
jgi:predicted enzyme related to lactoylglutathione lyase